MLHIWSIYMPMESTLFKHYSQKLQMWRNSDLTEKAKKKTKKPQQPKRQHWTAMFVPQYLATLCMRKGWYQTLFLRHIKNILWAAQYEVIQHHKHWGLSLFLSYCQECLCLAMPARRTLHLTTLAFQTAHAACWEHWERFPNLFWVTSQLFVCFHDLCHSATEN